MAYTSVGGGTTTYSQTAYDIAAYFSLRPQEYFDQVADVRTTKESMQGSSVVFNIVADLAEATSTLSETTDVTPVAISDSSVTVSLAEYGNAVNTTALLRGTSYVDLDPIVANVMGFNAGISMDAIARNVLAAGTNVNYAHYPTSQGTSRATVAAAEVLTSYDLRLAKATLASLNVEDFGGEYVCFIDPAVEFDLKSESGDVGWRDPHNYATAGDGPMSTNIMRGEIGKYEGFRFVSTPRAPFFSGAGASSANVYGTLCMGRQSLAKAWSKTDGNSDQPHIIMSPVVDSMRRFVPISWYHLVGYGLFRQASLLRIESAATVSGSITRPSIDN